MENTLKLSGLSAFPLTPFRNGQLDEAAYARMITRLAEARVDSIGALGSTGSGMYLTAGERKRALEITAELAAGIPVIVGTSSLRTGEVIRLADQAAVHGAAAVMVAPVSYLPLNDEEVFGLYQAVSLETPLPVVVYDNPGTTRFNFSAELHIRIANLPNITAIKLPGTQFLTEQGSTLLQRLRAEIPESVSIGVSGDPSGAAGLNAGCDVWFSSIGGTLPNPVQQIAAAALNGDHREALRLSEQLQPLWDLFAEHGGSIKVIAAIAELLGLVGSDPLPSPVLHLSKKHQLEVVAALRKSGLL